MNVSPYGLGTVTYWPFNDERPRCCQMQNHFKKFQFYSQYSWYKVVRKQTSRHSRQQLAPRCHSADTLMSERKPLQLTLQSPRCHPYPRWDSLSWHFPISADTLQLTPPYIHDTRHADTPKISWHPSRSVPVTPKWRPQPRWTFPDDNSLSKLTPPSYQMTPPCWHPLADTPCYLKHTPLSNITPTIHDDTPLYDSHHLRWHPKS